MHKKSMKGNSGFTVVELCIVLFILALIIAMISSFSMLVSVNLKTINYNSNMEKSIFTTKKNLTDFIDVFDNSEYEIEVTESALVAREKETTETTEYNYTITKDEETEDCYTLTSSSLPNGKTLSNTLENIKEIVFEQLTIDGNNCVKVSITYYTDADKKEDKTDTICIIKYLYCQNIVGDLI